MSAPEHMVRRWSHLFEEDHEGVLVYRPDDLEFPPARGRDGIEFKADGSFVNWAIGRGDVPEARPGTWQLDPEGRLRVTTPRGERVFDLVTVGPDRLELVPRRDS